VPTLNRWRSGDHAVAGDHRIPRRDAPIAAAAAGTATDRARIRSIALAIACDIHPIDNLRVLRYLVNELKVSEDDKNKCTRSWVHTGLSRVETQLAGDRCTGRFLTTATRRRWPTSVSSASSRNARR